jgi:hypothetical protein
VSSDDQKIWGRLASFAAAGYELAGMEVPILVNWKGLED